MAITDEGVSQMAARAAYLVREGYVCTEAILMAAGPRIARDWHPDCVRMATGFRGGIGRTRQDVCGALVGAVMLLGAKFGRTDLVDDTLVQSLAARMRERFVATYGTTCCGTIRETLIEVDGGPGTCALLVGQVMQMLLEIADEGGGMNG